MSGDMFTAVSFNRMSDAIVEQVRSLIRNSQLRPGDRLPSERELGDRVGASRVTVREALRVLEDGGLIEIRVGAKGGSFVTSPTSDRLGAGLADLLSLTPMTAAQVTEARLVVEIGIAPLVVERATVEDIEAMTELADQQVAALGRGAYVPSRSAGFHIRVAACAHNPAIDMLVNSFYRPLIMSLREAKRVAPRMGEHGAIEHRNFVAAVAARDVEAATDIMRMHIGRTARRLPPPDPLR